MADMTLPFATYLDSIGEDTERLLEAAREGLRANVATCPGWRMEDLVRHVADVYRTWYAQILAGDTTARTETDRPAPGDPTGDLEEQGARLLDALAATAPDAPCWNWSGEDLTVEWVARRMALEVSVHRVDAELTRGRANPVERELAIDGIDERLEVHLRLDLHETPDASLGGSLCLVCVDDPAAWMIDVERGRLRWRHGRGPADAVAVAGASDLFLFTWNRVGPDALELTGDKDVVGRWATLPS